MSEEGEHDGDECTGDDAPPGSGQDGEQRPSRWARAGSPTQPRPMLASVMPSCVAAMVRSRWSTALARTPPARRRPVDQLLDAGSAHGDEGELGGDEEAVQHDQDRHGRQPRHVAPRHAALLGN